MAAVFWLCAGATALGAILALASRNPILGACWLVVSLLSTAVLFLTLQAPLLAAIQVIVYTGATLVLILFVILLINLRPAERVEERTGATLAAALLLGGAFFGWVARQWLDARGSLAPWPPVPETFGSVASTAREIFSAWVVPFGAVSFLLLAAIVGAVVIGRCPAPEERELQ